MRIGPYIFTTLALLSACRDPQQDARSSNKRQPPAIRTSLHLIPADSIRPAVVVDAGAASVIPFTTKVTHTGSGRMRSPGKQVDIPVGKPYVAGPGTETYAKPLVLKAKGISNPCVLPLPVPAKNPRFKDNASINIQYLDVEQGLPESYVRRMFEDAEGNLWFASQRILSRYNGVSFTYFSSKEGYLDGGTHCISQDKKGNIWLGCGKGACMYDGSRFTWFNKESGVPIHEIKAITSDRSGDLWMASDSGICRYDGENFTFYTRSQGLIGNSVQSIFIDRQDNIWVGTTEGVSRFDGRTFSSWTTEQGLTGNNILEMDQDANGNIWLASESGICRYDGKNFTHFESEGLNTMAGRGLTIDSKGNIWVAAYGTGAIRYDGKELMYITEEDGLSYNNVWRVMEDRIGNIWMGTDGGGVCRYSGNSFFHFTAKQGMGLTIMTIFEDARENIWLGSYAAGLYKYDGKNFTWFNSAATLTVRSMLQDKNGDLIFGCEGAGFIRYNGKTFQQYTKKQGLVHDNVTSMLFDRKGNLWLGTSDGLSCFINGKFTNYSKEQGLCGNMVRDLIEDKKGNIWIVTIKGLNVFDGKNIYRLGEKEGLPGKEIKNILEDSRGNMWIGTIGAGLFKYDGQSLTNYTMADGLSDDHIRSIIEDHPKNLPKGMMGIWLSTDSGIDHILIGRKQYSDADTAREEMTIDIYKREDGLKGEDFTSNAGWQDSKGRIWWGSVKSLTVVDASTIHPPTVIPKITLDHIELEQKFVDFRSLDDSIKNGKKFLVGDKSDIDLARIHFTEIPPFSNYPAGLELPYDLSSIRFHFYAIDWNAPHKIRYQFMLEGADKDWNPETAEPTAGYMNLSPGDYTFRVKARGFSGVWSDPVEYHFVIRPPWWKTTWAYAGYVLLVIIAFMLFLKWRTKSLTDRQKELEQEVQLHTLQLRMEKEKVEEKNAIIEKKQTEILDSIAYAKRLQRSRMATERYIQNSLKRLNKDPE